ncbi:MAG: beta-propeller domain-containing protein [Candidatus Woesearchaeota archaeon]
MKLNLSILVLILIIFFSACQNAQLYPITTTEVSVFEENSDIQLQTFSSEEELQDFTSTQSSSRYDYGYATAKGGAILMDSVESVSSEVSSSSSNQNLDYSQTNNQVQNVDEGDIIKTDGEYIYTITGKTLFVIKAYPGEDSEVISKIKITHQPSGLFIYQNKLLIFGNVDDYSKVDESIRPRTQLMFAEIFDITNKQNIKSTSEFLFEGSYSQSRMIDNKIYLISNLYNGFSNPYPIYYENGNMRKIPYSNIYRLNIPYNYPEFAGIQSIDIINEKIINEKIIALESGMNIYMSENNLFLASTEYFNQWELQQKITKEILKPYLNLDDEELINEIQLTSNKILSNYEKESKIMQVYYEAMQRLSYENQDELQAKIQEKTDEEIAKIEYRTYSLISKVELNDGNLEVKNTAKIPGRLNNQFSMDEFKNNLRIATTIDSTWYNGKSTESENHIYTLSEDMNILDSIKGIAKTESIYSTRFVGDRLYMVTFRQIDPFFVFDLSNPENIKELGQLKIPGFSRYLHPYDENMLIGIGRDATEEGRQEGLKISLFDVSDPKNPKEVAKYVSDEKYSSSTAEYEHKAFLFSKEKELLVIPIYSYNYKSSGNFNGALVFKITEDEIKARGLIDHSSTQDNYYYGSMVERSLFIENELYTKSQNLLRINSLDDLSSINKITLKEDYEGDIPIY